jgi:carotenoid cleavage dioxygenase
MVGEFPRIDDRYAMSDYRHGWMLVMDLEQPCELKGGRTNAGLLMNTLGHYDHASGESKTWFCGPLSSLQEPCFIPRSADAPEGDGWLVMVENLLEQNLSNLLLFEATNIQDGPIATIRLPVRLRFGLHGNWTPGDQLKPLA